MNPIIWDKHKKKLKLLDQRLLPHRIEYIEYETAGEVTGAIRDMVVRGAPAIGISGAFGMALEAISMLQDKNKKYSTLTIIEHLNNAYLELKSARPTAVNLAWALDRMMNRLNNSDKTTDIEGIVDILLEEALNIMEEDVLINKRIGEAGAGLIPPTSRVLTHCNAGALATGGWGTALGVIRSAFRQKKIKMVYADETRPYLQGSRLTALELKEAGIPVTIITDSCAGYLMAKGEIDLVITGADCITAKGDVANKIGTYSLAVLARYHGIPFYVAAPLSTFDFNIEEGKHIIVEERSSEEITFYNGEPVAPVGVQAFNPSFDVTPASLISAIITENNIIRLGK